MTTQKYGNYGFLNQGQMDGEPLLLLDFGVEAREREAYDFDNADRDYDGFLFQYTLKGYGVFEEKGQARLLEPGTAFFSLIPEESRYYLPRQKDPSGRRELPFCVDPETNRWEYLYVHFTGSAALPFFHRIREEFGSCFCLPQDSFPIQLWLSLHQEMGSGRQLRRDEGGELVYRFLSSLLRLLETPDEAALSPSVEESIRYMKEHFQERLSIEDLAGRAGVSPAYFSRLFAAQTGQTPLSYLNHLRMNHAVFLLLNTSLTVEQIAGGCGFSCGNYFCKAFRRASGLSPAEYRRRYGG